MNVTKKTSIIQSLVVVHSTGFEPVSPILEIVALAAMPNYALPRVVVRHIFLLAASAALDIDAITNASRQDGYFELHTSAASDMFFSKTMNALFF